MRFGLVRYGKVGYGQVWYGKERAEHKTSALITIKMERNNLHYTNIEEKVRDYLEKKGIEYVFQYPTRTGFVIDFVILNQKIAIEVDGIKWHSSKEAHQRDRFKDYQLRREGWKVIRVKEDEINKMEELLLSATGNSPYLPKTLPSFIKRKSRR